MNESFACPECGGVVKLRGLAPGRRVRCGFCQQLIEIPYLPRVPSAKAKPGGSSWPRWVRWAWSAVGLAVAVILIWSGVRFWRNHSRSLQRASILKMIASSESHERAGLLNEALSDLDAALELARQASGSVRKGWEAYRKHRQELAQREIEETLEDLVRHGSASFSPDDWLKLIARCDRDPDLEPLKPRIDQQFQTAVGESVVAGLADARRSFDSGKFVASLKTCERIAGLLGHLGPDSQSARRRETEELVTRLLRQRGVVVDPAHGDFIFGSESSYNTSLHPIVVHALEKRDYLPYRAASPWAGLWKRALYHLQIQVSEQQEGGYLSTENRLILIRVHLTLSADGVSKWQSFPGSRSRVPLPNLPAYLSGRLAGRTDRSEEVESLLYKDALGQIHEKVGLVLTNIPAYLP